MLEELAQTHELPRRILDWRSVQKLKGTYVDALPQLVNPATGRVHTSFNQAVAATGRLSSSDPNLQNIPVRTEVGRQIRRAIVAAPGHVLISADYSQIEFRVLAHLSEDPVLVAAFHDGALPFTGIVETVARVVAVHLDGTLAEPGAKFVGSVSATVQDVLAAELWARAHARSIIGN